MSLNESDIKQPYIFDPEAIITFHNEDYMNIQDNPNATNLNMMKEISIFSPNESAL